MSKYESNERVSHVDTDARQSLRDYADNRAAARERAFTQYLRNVSATGLNSAELDAHGMADAS